MNMCNHNYMDSDNTLVGIPSLKMVYPMQYHLQCKECGEIINVSQLDIKDIKQFLHMFF